MSNCETVYKLTVPLMTDGGAVDSYTSEWFPCDGHEDRVISIDADSTGTPDVNIFIQFSGQNYYDLNNKTATTEDYQQIAVKDAHAATTYTRYDSSDVDDLQRPARSFRIYAAVDTGSDPTSATIWYEGRP